MAVKVLLSDDAAMRGAMEREAGVLALLRHPNLLLFIGFCAQPRPAILAEFMQRGRCAGLDASDPFMYLRVSLVALYLVVEVTVTMIYFSFLALYLPINLPVCLLNESKHSYS